MSGLAGSGIVAATDDRISDPQFRNDYSYLADSYRWMWSGSMTIGGLSTQTTTADKRRGGAGWGQYPSKGVRARKLIIGVTKDNAGAPVSNCAVHLHNTATDLVVDSVVSDAVGNFTVGDPNAVACYVVAYKSGSPDIAGVSNNTLTGV